MSYFFIILFVLFFIIFLFTTSLLKFHCFAIGYNFTMFAGVVIVVIAVYFLKFCLDFVFVIKQKQDIQYVVFISRFFFCIIKLQLHSFSFFCLFCFYFTSLWLLKLLLLLFLCLLTHSYTFFLIMPYLGLLFYFILLFFY